MLSFRILTCIVKFNKLLAIIALRMMSRQRFSFNFFNKNMLCGGFVRKFHVWNDSNVVRSPFKNVFVPEVTVHDYVWRVLDKWPLKTATVCGITNRSYTYEQMYKQSRTLGANLRKKFRLNDGDTVGIALPNIPEYPTVTFGALAAGSIISTYNPLYTAHEIQRQISLSETKLIFTHPELVPVIKKAFELGKNGVPIISVDVDGTLPEGTISYKELVEEIHVDLNVLKDVKRNAEDVCLLPFSSGTTGLPKGVELIHRNMVANCEQQNTECKLHMDTTETHQDSILVNLPMFHSYGLLILMLHKLAEGLKLITLPRFQPETFLDALLQHKINLLYVAPPTVLFLGSNPQVTEQHLEHVRRITSGAAPLPAADIYKLLDKSKGSLHFGQGYGMTETGPLVTIAPLDCNAYETGGYAIPNIELRVVDQNLNNLGPNEMGELVIKGPNVMKGYKNNPEANREVFLDDHWFRSGDMAKIDESGLVTVTDRLKELIKVKGYQVPPAELEGVLREYPAVFDAAVIGIPDSVSGEKPKAFVVLKEGFNTTDKDIMAFVGERVAPYKRIKEVMFVDSIPKNPSGKILRRILKEKYC